MEGKVWRILTFLGFTVAMFFLGALGGGIAEVFCANETNAQSVQLWIMIACEGAGIIPTIIYHCMSRFFTEHISDFFGWAVDAYFFDLQGDPRWGWRRILFPAKISRESEGKEFERSAPYREYLVGTLDKFAFETRSDAISTLNMVESLQEQDPGPVRRFFMNVGIVLLNALVCVLVGLKFLVFVLVLLAPLCLFGGASALGFVAMMSFNHKMFIGLYWLIPLCLMVAGLGGVIATSCICDWDWFRD